MELILERKKQGDKEHNEWIRITSVLELKIGRAVNSNIRLFSTYVSRDHAILFKTDRGDLLIKDCGSLYGVYINNQRICKLKSMPISDGDVVEIAKPPESDPIWKKMTFNDRFVYIACTLPSDVLDRRPIGLVQHHCDLFNGISKKGKGLGVKNPTELSITQPENIPSCSKSFDKNNCSNKIKLDTVNFPKTLQVLLDKSEKIAYVITNDLNKTINPNKNNIEQENKRLKLELEKKESEINSRDNKIKGLEQSSKTVERLVDAMESELQCSVCNEVFIKSTTLNCAHIFCEFCILQWKKKKMECPICREKITSSVRSLPLDNYINKVLEGMSEALQTERKNVLKEREIALQKFLEEQKPKKEKTRPTRNRRNRRRRPAVINTGIPVIRVQNINLTGTPNSDLFDNDDVVIVDVQQPSNNEPIVISSSPISNTNT